MRRRYTRLAITLVALNAGLAIVILATGDPGEVEGRILGTSLLATASALLAMVQTAGFDERRRVIGIGAALTGFVVVTIGIWTETDVAAWWRLGGTAYTVGTAGAVSAVLSARPLGGRNAWLQQAARILVAAAATMIVGGIWFEPSSDAYWRVFAVIAVLIAASGLAIPILHRSSGGAGAHVAHCPLCGGDVDAATEADITCVRCSRTFRVRVRA